MRDTFQMNHTVDNHVGEIGAGCHAPQRRVRFHLRHGKKQLTGEGIPRERKDVGRFIFFAVAIVQLLYFSLRHEHD